MATLFGFGSAFDGWRVVVHVLMLHVLVLHVCTAHEVRQSLSVTYIVLHLTTQSTITKMECSKMTFWVLFKPSAADPVMFLLQARILPILASIISHANSNSSILVEGALDVLVSLVKAASPEQAQQMHSTVGPHIQTLMLQHQDAGILQSCCQYLK